MSVLIEKKKQQKPVRLFHYWIKSPVEGLHVLRLVRHRFQVSIRALRALIKRAAMVFSYGESEETSKSSIWCQDSRNMLMKSLAFIPHNANFNTRFRAQSTHVFSPGGMWLLPIWKLCSALCCVTLAYHFARHYSDFLCFLFSSFDFKPLESRTLYFVPCSIFIQYSLNWNILIGKVMLVLVTSKVANEVKTKYYKYIVAYIITIY